MIIDTRTVKEGHTTLCQSTDLGELAENLPSLQKKIDCTASIDRINAMLVIQLHFEAVVINECARCLENYPQTVTGDCRVILEERSGMQGPAGEEDTADFYFNEEHSLVDIGVVIFEEVMTSIPLMPLCNDACKGVELPKKTTSANEESYDPRWEALRKLKK